MVLRLLSKELEIRDGSTYAIDLIYSEDDGLCAVIYLVVTKDKRFVDRYYLVAEYILQEDGMITWRTPLADAMYNTAIPTDVINYIKQLNRDPVIRFMRLIL